MNRELVTGLEGQKGLWRATGSLVSRRPRTVWVASVLLLLVASAGILQLKANGVPQTDVILTASNAVDGQDALARHFDAGSGSPAVMVADESKAARGAGEGQGGRRRGGRLPAGGRQRAHHRRPRPELPATRTSATGKVLINATLNYAADSSRGRGRRARPCVRT